MGWHVLVSAVCGVGAGTNVNQRGSVAAKQFSICIYLRCGGVSQDWEQGTDYIDSSCQTASDCSELFAERIQVLELF